MSKREDPDFTLEFEERFGRMQITETGNIFTPIELVVKLPTPESSRHRQKPRSDRRSDADGCTPACTDRHATECRER